MEHAQAELSAIKVCCDLVDLIAKRTDSKHAVVMHQFVITYDNTMRLLSSERDLVGAMEGMHNQFMVLLSTVGAAAALDPSKVLAIFDIFVNMQQRVDKATQEFVNGLIEAGATIADAKKAMTGSEFIAFANGNLDLSDLFIAAKEL